MDIFEVAHQMGLIPIIFLMAFGRRSPRAFWLVGLALMVSWFGDSAMHFIGGGWVASYFWLPVQMWLVLLAFIRSPTNRIASGLALLVLGPVSMFLSWPGPDQLITIRAVGRSASSRLPESLPPS